MSVVAKFTPTLGPSFQKLHRLGTCQSWKVVLEYRPLGLELEWLGAVVLKMEDRHSSGSGACQPSSMTPASSQSSASPQSSLKPGRPGSGEWEFLDEKDLRHDGANLASNSAQDVQYGGGYGTATLMQQVRDRLRETIEFSFLANRDDPAG
jgi:hypothetical protein